MHHLRFLLFFLLPGMLFWCADIHVQQKFSTTYREEALSANEMPEIRSDHPRLLIRNGYWKRGPDVESLRKDIQKGPLRTYLKERPWDPQPGLEWAFRYLLTKDETLVRPIVEIMKKSENYWPGWLLRLALLYDWLYGSPSFTEQDKKIVEDKMIAWAEQAIKTGEKYTDMWSHFGYGPPVDLAAAGLALYGHRKEAKEYIAMAGGYVKKNMYRGWALNDGAWQGGWVYYGQGAACLFQFIALWSSATGEDLYEEIEKDQGDWLKNHLYYLIRTQYPDGTPFENTGFSYSPYRPGVLFVLLNLTCALNDVAGFKALQKIGIDSVPWWAGIDQFLYYFPMKNRGTPAKEIPDLTQCWGRKGLGYVQMNSGWGAGDTMIEFKCGDYFWSHQFQNQNSFTIYRKGRLAIQSGAYDAYFGNHMQFYYRPTVSSNSMLVIQPKEVTWIPTGVADENRIPHQNGTTKVWGGQRTVYLIPEYGSAETCFTFNKYLYRKDHEHHFETGDIKAFEVTDRYSYVSGDATMAYNNPVFSYPGNKPKLDLFTRGLVFLDKKYLVVFDRVNSLDAEYEKRWLLHSVGEPLFQGNPIQVEYPGHQEIHQSGLVRIDNQGGTLYCQTLFPEEYLIRKVGGGATVTPVKADSANKGSATLKTTIQGKFERVSPAVASDAAAKDDWTIEFSDSQTFRIKGTVTGDDGNGSLKNEVFVSNSQSIFIPKENWKGTPEKGDKLYFSVTSPSYRFWVDGKNQPPSPTTLYNIIKDESRIDPGNWRIEVFPKKRQKYDTFLHLLYPCDRNTSGPPIAEGITSSEDKLKGINVENWIVFFPAHGLLNQRTEYVIKNKDKTANLLLDMVPGRSYGVEFSPGSSGEASAPNSQRMTASKEGTLFFIAPGSCRVGIIPF